MEATTITAVFTAAATATTWTQSTRGLSTKVDHDGFTWVVQLPPESGKAYISGTTGYGGDTCEYVEATWAETFPIVDAALNATRLR